MQVRSWLIRLILAGTLLTGCNASSDFDRQKTTPMAEPTYLSGVTINASTVGRLDGGWSVGVQWVSNEEDYVDAEGKAQRGRLARISVWNDTLGKNDILEVYEGMIFSVGEQRFQVIELKPNSSLSVKPGSSNGYITIGQLP